jgi:BCD family chlorophyll transporter-like MFS transporter
MEDVLLEPYGGEILGMTVAATTFLTATLALGSLIGFGFAAQTLSRGGDPMRMAGLGALIGIPAFLIVIIAAPLASSLWFSAGVFLIGLGAGLFGHGTLTATMGLARPGQSGLALGAWGAVQATAAGLGIALGGILRDLGGWFTGRAEAYAFVYSLEVALLLVTLVVIAPLVRLPASRQSPQGLTDHP